MGKRGPPPKPSKLKKLQGTFRPDRAARNEVIAPPGAPPRPSTLGKKGSIAGLKWDELVAILLDRGTLSKEDGVSLEQFCRFYAQWLKFQKVAEAKPMVETPFGPKVNPANEAAIKLEQRLTALGDRLGLQASARSKVSAPEKKPEVDPAEAFLFSGPKLVEPAK